MAFIVYKVIFPNSKVYIGITSKTLEFRKRQHYKEARKIRYNYKFYNALNKYKNKEIWEIEDSSANSWEELKNLEKNYIKKYNSFEKGYNLTFGGDGKLGYKFSEESKKKMRGPRPQTSKALKGRKLSENHKLNLALRIGKPFEVFDNNAKSLGVFNNQSECARLLKLNRRNLQSCLNKTRKSHKGLTFKYIEEKVC